MRAGNGLNCREERTLEVLIAINGRELDRLKIVNDSTGTEESANYIVHHSEGSFRLAGHNRAHGAWRLAKKAIHKYVEWEGLDLQEEHARRVRQTRKDVAEAIERHHKIA